MGLADERRGDGGPLAPRASPLPESFASRRAALWVVVLAFFCVGDVLTTRVGLSVDGVVEAGPVVAPLLRVYGLAAMVGLKGATVGLFYGVARLLPEPYSVGVPLGLALMGVFVTGWNLFVLYLGIF
jgi:hypothetical protein